MLDVLGATSSSSQHPNVLAVVKVLVTNPRPTSTVRVGFDDENVNSDSARETKTSILCIESLTLSHVDASRERINRNLGGIGDDEVRRGPEEGWGSGI